MFYLNNYKRVKNLKEGNILKTHQVLISQFQTSLVWLPRLGDRLLLLLLPVGGEVRVQPSRGGRIQRDGPLAQWAPHLEHPQ